MRPIDFVPLPIHACTTTPLPLSLQGNAAIPRIPLLLERTQIIDAGLAEASHHTTARPLPAATLGLPPRSPHRPLHYAPHNRHRRARRGFPPAHHRRARRKTSRPPWRLQRLHRVRHGITRAPASRRPAHGPTPRPPTIRTPRRLRRRLALRPARRPCHPQRLPARRPDLALRQALFLRHRLPMRVHPSANSAIARAARHARPPRGLRCGRPRRRVSVRIRDNLPAQPPAP